MVVLVCACLVVVDWVCGCHIVVCVDTTNNFTATSTCLGYLLLFIMFRVFFIRLRVSSCFHSVVMVKLVVVDRFVVVIRKGVKRWCINVSALICFLVFVLFYWVVI